MKRSVVVIIVAMILAGCRGPEEPKPAPGEVPPPPAPRRAAELSKEGAAQAVKEAEAQAAEQAEKSRKLEEMLGSHKKEREILVGGCGKRCRAPLDGFRGFARALWRLPDPDEPQPLLRFVDTSELVDGEERLGRGWADLFLEGQLETRREGIEAWREGFAARMGTLEDPSNLQAALDGPLDMTRRSADVVVVHFAAPATDKGDGGEIWHFTFGRRGLEWLLRGVTGP